MTEVSNAEIKLTIAKLVELAYSEDKGLTAKIVAQKGSFKISVDQSGNASLSSSVGIVTFKGSPALESLGLKLKRASISFTRGEGFTASYIASFNFGVFVGSYSGIVDVERLIIACSGLLCIASRGIKGRDKHLEDELNKAMGY